MINIVCIYEYICSSLSLYTGLLELTCQNSSMQQSARASLLICIRGSSSSLILGLSFYCA